jgi:hypothetical protein
MEHAHSRWRRRVRVTLAGTAAVVVLGLWIEDCASRSHGDARPPLRVVTVNVNARPDAVVGALAPLHPDLVLMQETGGSCEGVAQQLGLAYRDGSDQCVLSRWTMAPQPVSWPGPWQPPQVIDVASEDRHLRVLNARLAMPSVFVRLTTLGSPWYTEAQRRAQMPALRALLQGKTATIACGDWNAWPAEVDLGSRFADGWTRWSYGATFPALLPAARIDQCWASREIGTPRAWTLRVASDHRAAVFDFPVGF